ncbi:hypothetical protein N7495_004215 [Penicillium taxi]|uniref:uncharacterized protein n=1 Tax=Penicillium taxi TaxID=168475 RepID=UPI002544FBA1|nr:uncharacterized protein N7495_004215 [Penicillium taxi]KAJ5899471.1 hypothetical protein N7495_004215 [Penicillium taxi]
MSVASDSYFGTMQPNSNQYFWDNRSYQHLQQQQQQPQHMTPQFPPLQSYPSSAIPIDYGGHPSGPMQGYHQDSAPSSAYIPSSAGARQHYSRRSSHHSPMSSQAASLISDPVFSPADSLTTSDADRQVRVISSRPRPQCWDHGCNGREFSTFSNLLRHQREKSGVVAKAECPICRAVFTRTTARNIHVAQGKCKGTGRESSSE